MSSPRPPLVPYQALAAGHLAHGLSWILLAVLGARGQLGFSLPGLAWIHLVALGWLTTVSLAMLIHVLEEIFGLKWPGGTAVRYTIGPFVAGAAVLVTGFLTQNPAFLALGGLIAVLAIVVWVGFAFGAAATFVPQPHLSRRALAAFQMVMVFLVITALIGFAMAYTLWRGTSTGWTLTGMPIHAHLGAMGWLTMLILGAAQRTMRVIFGYKSPFLVYHIVALSAFSFAIPCLVAGLWGGWTALLYAGWVFATVGVLAQVGDVRLLVKEARRKHRPPKAFVVMATLWMAVAAVLGIGVLLGQPWQAAYAFVALAGWAGQMVNGHLHIVPIVVFTHLWRVPPRDPAFWLDDRRSWGAFYSFQIAILLALAGSLGGVGVLVLAAGVLGFLGWLAMTTNLVQAISRLSRMRSA